MSTDTAGTLAQIVPVLMLTLLFEIRARPDTGIPRPSKLAVIVGFTGNFVIAVTALVLEFGLLGVVEQRGMSAGARWLWVASFSLFAVVVVRWAAVSTARALLREAAAPFTAGVKGGLSASAVSVSSSLWAVLIELLVAPATVVASMLAVLWAFIAGMVTSLARAVAALARTVDQLVARIGRKGP